MTEREKTGERAALARLCQFDLLSAEDERRLFSRLERMRAKALRLRTRDLAKAARVSAEMGLSQEVAEIRNRIVESNLRLVVSLAKHFAVPEHALEELVSEASLPLIRCVESFDLRRGTRFSTYATRALINFFAKLRRQDYRRRSHISPGEAWKRFPARRGGREMSEGLIHAEDLSRLDDRLAKLSPRERALVAERFGLTGDRRPRTFRELGQRHGLSKERVRVLTGEVISRLRQSFDEALPP